MSVTCKLCRKFHTYECPAEDQDSIRFKTYIQDQDSLPFNDTCFESKEGEKISPHPRVIYFHGKLPEMTVEELESILSSTIKRDNESKLITFLAMLLNYTEEDQQNIAFSGPSSGGKSWVALQVAKYFPEEDIIKFGYSSPQAFFHLPGILVDKNFNPIPSKRDYVEEELKKWDEANPKPEKGEGLKEWKERREEEKKRLKNEWDKIEKYHMIDLERKILIFLDMPHDELLQRLRPLLSHDQKIIFNQIVDKSKSGALRTKQVAVKGFPTVLFLAVNSSLDGQERSRNFLLSPEITQDKLKESILQLSECLKDRKTYQELKEMDTKRQTLRLRVRIIKESGISEVLLTDEDMNYITDRFLKDHPRLQPRHQRDFPRLIALIKALALLNFTNRKMEGNKIWALRQDSEKGYELYKKISEANESELPPHYYKFYKEKLRSNLPATRKEVAHLYYEYYNVRIGERALKRMIDSLCEAGLVMEDKDPNDKRVTKIYDTGLGVEISPTPPVPSGGGQKNPQTPGQGQAGNTTREGGDKIPPSSVDKECCKRCQEFEPSTEFCHVTGERTNPDFHCGKFKPRPKRYKCKTCGCGPWSNYKIAMEHLSLDGFHNHEIMEVHENASN